MKIVDLKGQNRSLFINNELGNEKKGLSHVIVIGKRDKIYVVAPLIEDKKANLLFSRLFICKCICKVCYKYFVSFIDKVEKCKVFIRICDKLLGELKILQIFWMLAFDFLWGVSVQYPLKDLL